MEFVIEWDLNSKIELAELNFLRNRSLVMLSKLSIVDFLLYFGLLQFVIYWPFQADYWGEHLPLMCDQDVMEQMFNGSSSNSEGYKFDSKNIINLLER